MAIKRGPLGRRTPTDWLHVEKYPLRALGAEATTIVAPVALGTNWYEAFDKPEKVGNRYIVGRSGNLGKVRGGHCYATKPKGVTDLASWWVWYNQGQEGACGGFGTSRVQTLNNRQKYDGFWLYHQAQLVDEYPDTPPEEGTSVRAAFSVLKEQGPMSVDSRGKDTEANVADGISAYRWATEADEVVNALGYGPSATLIPFLNSWGKDYPHVTWMPVEVLARLLSEEGEAGIPTDR